jgi:16S rRNA (adenine1518-N6/adenine1519-N6)-dimethyltransferase
MATRGKRRALGQHFLRDSRICERIAETAVEQARAHGCAALLEIGPGRGAITHPLRARAGELEFFVAERDPELVAHWRQEAPTLRVEAGDFLELPEERWLGRTPLAVVSNLPYSVGTAIATRLARHTDTIPVMVLMFQAEVAQRLRAEPGTKAWGSLSVWIQNRWDVTKLLSVPPGAFSPPPEVDSEVVILTRRKQPRVDVAPDAEEKWQTLLRLCFAHRRKMLRSGLPSDGPWRKALLTSSVNGTSRAEALNWDDWKDLFSHL